MKNITAKLQLVVIVLLSVGLFVLGLMTFQLRKDIASLSSSLGTVEHAVAVATLSAAPIATVKPSSVITKNESDVDAAVVSLKEYIDQKIAAIPAPQAAPVTKSQKTSYVSMGTSYSSASTDWITVPDSSVYIDLANDYSLAAYVTWDVSLKVAHGNGTAYARLYDATNNIAVQGSELKVENTATATQVFSGKLELWRGNNLYVVQVKSLNGYEVTASGGRVKVVY